jgi:hypothetical protein
VLRFLVVLRFFAVLRFFVVLRFFAVLRFFVVPRFAVLRFREAVLRLRVPVDFFAAVFRLRRPRLEDCTLEMLSSSCCCSSTWGSWPTRLSCGCSSSTCLGNCTSS